MSQQYYFLIILSYPINPLLPQISRRRLHLLNYSFLFTPSSFKIKKIL